MDEVIWVEVLSRHRSVIARHRCTGRVIRIGRAYTNDVLLDDPYVAPEHAYIARDETGRLLVEDLGTANGILAEHGRKRLDRLALDGESVFRLGQTYLRVRGAAAAVAPERQLGIPARGLPAIAALFLAVFLGEAVGLWLRDYSEPRAETYVVPLIGGLVLIGGWSGLWSLIARVFAGSAQFGQNLRIALAGALGLEVVRALSAITAFGLAWSMLGRYAMVELLGVAAVVCFFHMRQINPMRTLAAGAAIALLLLATASVVLVVGHDSPPAVSQLYVRNLLPPGLRLAPAEDDAAFFGAVDKLRHRIDQDRAAAP